MGRLDAKKFRPVYARYRSIPLVSISDANGSRFHSWTRLRPFTTASRMILHFNPGTGKYLAFVDGISPEKRPDLAIEVARRLGISFKIAANIDVVDRDYLNTVVEQLLSSPDVEYMGEISDSEKSEFLGNALALIFTIDWPEQFGLVMIEAWPVVRR